MPKPLASSSRPSDLLYSPLPSASINTRSPTPWALPHAFITKTSFTAMQAMVSTPLARIWSASCTKPGRCLASHVGVKAPGTENNTTVLPLKSSSVLRSLGPSFVMRLKEPEGIRSPALMVMSDSLSSVCDRRSGLLRVQCPKIGQLFQRRIAFHGLEGFHRIVLVTGLELGDAERQACIRIVLHVALGQTLRELVVGLVVLAVAKIGAADCDVLVSVRGRVRFLLELRQPR